MIRDPWEYYYRLMHAPVKTRKIIALCSTITFSIIVFFVWASTFSLDFTRASTNPEVARSPLASIFESVQSLFQK